MRYKKDCKRIGIVTFDKSYHYDVFKINILIYKIILAKNKAAQRAALQQMPIQSAGGRASALIFHVVNKPLQGCRLTGKGRNSLSGIFHGLSCLGRNGGYLFY